LLFFKACIKLIIVIIIVLGSLMIDTGRKHSKKRDAILAVIQSTAAHPSARWVYEKLKPVIPGLSLGTVYRNLKVFREEGLVISLGVVDGEERFDGRVSPHPHFICGRCGTVIDIPCPDKATLSGIAGMGGGEDGPGNFAIDYRKTVFYGLCGDCSN
jgi:Fur family peroxide stress response transcriptional regulator